MTFNLFFNLILITAIVADFFFNLDTVGIIALGALPMSTNLSSLIPSSATSQDFVKFPFDHDFVLDGRPQSFKRNANGSLIPSIGAEVVTAYGIGYIERRHVGGDVIVRITEFDETVEIPQYANPVEVNAFGVVKGFITAREQVGILSSLYNNRTMNKALWFESHMRDVAYAEELMELILDDDCYQVSFTGGDYGGCTEFVFAPAVNPNRGKKSTAETAAYRARIKALADKMLEDADDTEAMPEGMADELAEVFGS